MAPIPMKTFFPPWLSTSLLLAFSLPALAAPQAMDKVVAIVGKSVITQSELTNRINEIKQQPANEKVKLPAEDILRKQVLDHLITEHLQMAMAERVGIKISDEQLNAAMATLAKNNRMTPAQLEDAIKSEGLNMASFRARIARELRQQQVQRGMVTSRIKISDLEIDNFLKSADAKFWISPDYHLAQIMIALPSSPSADEVAEAEKKINALYDRVKQGEDFAATALAHSNAQDALKGGDLGWRKSSELPSLFAEIVAGLPVGGISKPARSPAGFHILKLYETRGDQNQVITQSHVRHILLKPSAILTNEEARAKLLKLRADIAGGADFAALAKAHSEDLGTLLNGGDLGWSNPGQFVPEFENAIADAKIGEISQPFKSQFGWHILQVLERRQEDMTQEVLRRKAINLLTSRRFEDELQVWLSELREDAYIDIKP